MELTVATLNIRNGRALDGRNAWLFRRRATAEAIRGLDADLVGLQEAYQCQMRSLRRRLPEFNFSGEGRSGGHRGEHTPVLVRGSCVGQTATRWFGPTPGGRLAGARFPRIATTVSLPHLHFTSTHLDEASTSRRNASAAQLRDWLGEMPGLHVVVGDFNADASASLFKTLGLRRVDPGGSGTSHHFSGRSDGRQIDHILVSPEIEVLRATVAHPRPGGRLPSDHWPVVARLRLPAGRVT